MHPFRAAALAFMLAAAIAHVQAQSPGLPDTYSFVAAGNMGAPMTITVHRNGSRELVETLMDSGSKLHLRQFYDFQAHRVYTLDLVVNRCTSQEYISPFAPALHDPIGSAAEMVAASRSLPVVRTEKVNGIATKLVELALPEGRGKYRHWLDEKFGFPVKQALVLGSQPESTLFEIRQISYAPSPETSFTPPPDCTRVAGVTSATGGHAEVDVEVKVPPQTHQLGQQPGAAAKVTAVRLRLVPGSYQGPCPSRVRLLGDITTDGPGTVWYQFLAGAVKKSGPGEGTVRFTAAGTQTVTLEAEYVRTPSVPRTSLIAVMTDEQGRHGPQNVSSGPVNYNAACTGQVPAVKR